MSVSVCMYVCLSVRDNTFETTRPIFTEFLCTLPLAEARSDTRSLGLGYNLYAVIPVAGQRTHGATFRALKVNFQVAAPCAESALFTAQGLN